MLSCFERIAIHDPDDGIGCLVEENPEEGSSGYGSEPGLDDLLSRGRLFPDHDSIVAQQYSRRVQAIGRPHPNAGRNRPGGLGRFTAIAVRTRRTIVLGNICIRIVISVQLRSMNSSEQPFFVHPDGVGFILHDLTAGCSGVGGNSCDWTDTITMPLQCPSSTEPGFDPRLWMYFSDRFLPVLDGQYDRRDAHNTACHSGCAFFIPSVESNS